MQKCWKVILSYVILTCRVIAKISFISWSWKFFRHLTNDDDWYHELDSWQILWISQNIPYFQEENFLNRFSRLYSAYLYGHFFYKKRDYHFHMLKLTKGIVEEEEAIKGDAFSLTVFLTTGTNSLANDFKHFSSNPCRIVCSLDNR